jgi:hypothetical protein
MILKSSSSLGLRFTTAPWHTQIHPTLKSLLEAFRRLTQNFEIGTLFPEVTAPTDNDPLVIIQHELLSTHYSHTTSNEIEKGRRRHHPNLNEPFRLSLIIYLYTRVSYFQNLPIMRCMVQTFKQSLEVALPGCVYHPSMQQHQTCSSGSSSSAAWPHRDIARTPSSWAISRMSRVFSPGPIGRRRCGPWSTSFSTRAGRRIRGRRTCGVR